MMYLLSLFYWIQASSLLPYRVSVTRPLLIILETHFLSTTTCPPRPSSFSSLLRDPSHGKTHAHIADSPNTQMCIF